MTTEFVSGPFGRVEGDLDLRLTIDHGVVLRAEADAGMFRGFEQILERRPPGDALVIAPRICGICSVSQSMAAAAALSAAGAGVAPENARRAMLLAHAAENLADHLTHFYLFFAPDLAREAYATRLWREEARRRFAAPEGVSRARALAARARLLHVAGIILGKWPHTLAIQPSGLSNPLDGGARIRLLAAINGFRRFLEAEVYAGPLEEFAALKSLAALEEWRAARPAASGDLPFFLEVSADLGLERLGLWRGGQMSFGAYASGGAPLDGALLFRRGIRRMAGVEELDLTLITEDVAHARLNGEIAAPRVGRTSPAPKKPAAYSWSKAPRYAGEPVEVGAFARQLIDGQSLIADAHRCFGSTVGFRVLARWIEVARLLPVMERWAREIDPAKPFFAEGHDIRDGEGVGLVEAARGALGHWLQIGKGRIERYQIVAPTTWNFSPRDSVGVAGPLEAALEGAPAEAGVETPAIQHIVRSFDPCMVCTVH